MVVTTSDVISPVVVTTNDVASPVVVTTSDVSPVVVTTSDVSPVVVTTKKILFPQWFYPLVTVTLILCLASELYKIKYIDFHPFSIVFLDD